MHRKEGIYSTAGIFCSLAYVQKRRNVLYRRLRNILYSRICTEEKKYIVQKYMYKREEIKCTAGYVQNRRNIF